jgi:hypothetical protein
MKTPSSIPELPNVSAMYALYGGQSKGMYVAYVGLAKQLKTRIIQHLDFISDSAKPARGYLSPQKYE